MKENHKRIFRLTCSSYREGKIVNRYEALDGQEQDLEGQDTTWERQISMRFSPSLLRSC